jgi:hypothetical protein
LNLIHTGTRVQASYEKKFCGGKMTTILFSLLFSYFHFSCMVLRAQPQAQGDEDSALKYTTSTAAGNGKIYSDVQV